MSGNGVLALATRAKEQLRRFEGDSKSPEG